MKKGLKSISLVLVIMLLAMMVAACSKKGSKISVGIVLPTKDEPRWVQDEQRFKDSLNGIEIYDRNFVQPRLFR